MAGRADGNAFGDAAAALRVVRALDGVEHGRETHGLHADDLDIGLDGLGRRGHARNQTAAADRHHQRVQVRHILQHFQSDRALAGHDIRIVIGMDKNKLLLLSQRQRVGTSFVQRVAMQNDLGAETARALHFDARREAWHHNHGAQAQALRVVSHTLRMVAGAHGDDAALAFFRAELRQFVAGAALLEGGGELQVLEFQEYLGPGDVRQGARGHAGRAQQLALQAGGGGLNVVEFNHACIVC